MVITGQTKGANRGFLMTELIVAMGFLTVALMPLAYTLQKESSLLRATYQRALAMEIVDGEMEILAAGEWPDFPEGGQRYPVRAAAAANLPPGQFRLTRTGHHLRLEWLPAEKTGVGVVAREVTVP